MSNQLKRHFAAGKAADALAAYDQALAAIKDGPLAARARLGRAVSKLQLGKGADASTELKQLAGAALSLELPSISESLEAVRAFKAPRERRGG